MIGPVSLNTSAPHLNGPAPRRSPSNPDNVRASSAGRIWPLMIVGLLGMNVLIVALTVLVSRSDASFAIEPDYYRKAVDWDKSARQRDASTALGWQCSLNASGSTITLDLHTSTGAPLDGAAIKAEIFHQARSSDRRIIDFHSVGGGAYAADFPFSQTGHFECRLTARRGPDTFAQTSTISVAYPAGTSTK